MKGEAKDLSKLEEPISAVVVCKSRDAASFKEGLVATLRTKEFATLSINDIDIEKQDGNPLEDKDIVWPGGTIKVKIKAKPNNPDFFGETDIFTINHYFYPNNISLTDLEEPTIPILSPDGNVNLFRTSLIAALRNGKYNGLNRGGVKILKENGDPLDSEYIGTNDSVTVKFARQDGIHYFSETKILKIQRLRQAKLTTRFRIS